jgi:hypothetical protein
MYRLVSGALATLALCGSANADVAVKAPDPVTICVVTEAPLNLGSAWTRLVDVGSWWNGSHSYSRDAKSLSLDAELRSRDPKKVGALSSAHPRSITVEMISLR